MLYACDKYPLKAVGYASFLWQPLTCDSVVPTPQRRLWLWVHPTCHGEVCQELEKSFPSSTETPSRVTGISMETVSSDSCKAEVLNTNNDKSVLEVQNEKMEVATKPLEEKSTLRSFSGSRETLNDSIKKPSVTVKKSEVLNTDSDKLVIEVKNDTMEVDTKLTEVNSTLTCVSDSQETLNGSAKKPSVKGNKSDSKLKKSKVKKSKKSGIKNPKKNIIVNWKMSAKDVEGESLKDCLVRFRLTGPASQAILSQTVQVRMIFSLSGLKITYYSFTSLIHSTKYKIIKFMLSIHILNVSVHVYLFRADFDKMWSLCFQVHSSVRWTISGQILCIFNEIAAF